MLILFFAVVLWALGLLVALGLCQSAAAGDRHLASEIARAQSAIGPRRGVRP